MVGFTSKRLNEDEPIVVFTYEEKLTREIFQRIIAENARHIAEIGEPIYIIADVRKLETTFLDMLQVMQEAQQERDGSAHDENIKMLIFVGSSSFARMYRDTMQKRGTAFGMSMFEDMPSAILAAQLDYKRNKSNTA